MRADQELFEHACAFVFGAVGAERGACERFNALDEKFQLGAVFGPSKDDQRREFVEREEGWILGANA